MFLYTLILLHFTCPMRSMAGFLIFDLFFKPKEDKMSATEASNTVDIYFDYL